jgi:hypothetical protein
MNVIRNEQEYCRCFATEIVNCCSTWNGSCFAIWEGSCQQTRDNTGYSGLRNVCSQAVHAAVWQKETFQEVPNVYLMISYPADERGRESASVKFYETSKSVRNLSFFFPELWNTSLCEQFVIYFPVCCKMSHCKFRVLWNKLVETFELFPWISAVVCTVTGWSLPTQNVL